MTASEMLAAWSVAPVTASREVRRAALDHLLDGLGTALAALARRDVAPAVQVALELAGPEEAAAPGLTTRVGAPAAAFVTGALIHGLDFDDTHPRGLVHVTAVVAPAALAVGQQVGASGREVVDALVVGDEVACRVAAAAPHGFHARGVHATMAAGVFSSAAASARLMGLDSETASHALGIAGSQAGGLMAFLNSSASTKQLHPGMASQAGVLAARLAAAGATGPANVFEGPFGLYDALTDGPVDRSVLTAELGRTWMMSDIGIKLYPACQLSHAAMVATAEVLRQHEVTASDIEAIEVAVHPDSAQIVCDTSRDLSRPGTSYSAKFSLPWSVAALVVDGAVNLDTYSPDSIARDEVIDLARRVRWRLIPDEGPAAEAPGWARVWLRDGTIADGRVPHSIGGNHPPRRDQIVGKFLSNAGPHAHGVVDAVDALEEQSSLTPLMEALAAAHRVASHPGKV